MIHQPVALQGGNQGLNGVVEPELGPGHSQEGKGNDKGPDRPLAVFEVDQNVDQKDGPGEKDNRFIKVGKGRMAGSAGDLVGFVPAQPYGGGMHEKAAISQNVAQKGNRLAASD